MSSLPRTFILQDATQGAHDGGAVPGTAADGWVARQRGWPGQGSSWPAPC